MPTLLDRVAPKPPPQPRSAAAVSAELRLLADDGALDLPRPGHGETAARWSALAGLGRRDLALARLAEGHTDAVAILAEAEHERVPDALYGVWAARSAGTGAVLEDGELTGTVRFCSGARSLDRALVVAEVAGAPGPPLLVDVDLADPRVRPVPETWQAIGMDASDSGDVRLDDVPVTGDQLVGAAGWYVSRPGFALGGAGVAAVWLGGCAAVEDSVVAYLRERGDADEHQRAHLGAVHTAISAADAQLAHAASTVDEGAADLPLLAALCRAGAERAAREVLDRAPEITGPTALCRDRRFAQQLADLLVYVRQHHGARDLAGLGTRILQGSRP
jgi:alkylation response protein AidB-like acyl-CoA dehydrogenase